MMTHIIHSVHSQSVKDLKNCSFFYTETFSSLLGLCQLALLMDAIHSGSGDVIGKKSNISV